VRESEGGRQEEARNKERRNVPLEGNENDTI
jgi:hypothetical protein